MRRLVPWQVAGVMVLVASPVAAQERDARAELLARGTPMEFAASVARVVEAAAARGLPVDPIIDKALEGWAKRQRVAPDRVLAVLRQLPDRLAAGRAAAESGGLSRPGGSAITAAAEALGRGLTADQVGEVIAVAPTPEAATSGLTVAASLAAQGLESAAAVRAVHDAFQTGQGPEGVLELPSAVAGLRARGMPMGDVARRIMEGSGVGMPGPRGAGRPATIPPGTGRKRGSRRPGNQ